MIDQAIYKVFKRDKKVIIPDFGAFIHSEITDTADFNALLNFDDGKIIAQIQKQQNLSEEDSKKYKEWEMRRMRQNAGRR